MHDSIVPTALRPNRMGITNPEVLKRLEAAMLAPPQPESAATYHPRGPTYEYHRPWYERLLAKGCNRCGGDPHGWVQKQIQTPYRFKRLVLWLVNLLPRGTSLLSAVLSRTVPQAQYAERQAACATCPSAVIQLKVVQGLVCETSYCGLCDCPKWYGSRNAVRNWRSAWRCPAKRHAGSDRDAVFAAYIRAKVAALSGDSNGR